MALMTKVLDIFKSKQAFVVCQECHHKGRFDEFKIEDSIMMHCPHCHYSLIETSQAFFDLIIRSTLFQFVHVFPPKGGLPSVSYASNALIMQ
jgi:hypothetical protein